MGVSREKAAQNRRAIVEGAETLFRQRGVEAVGLVELMAAAGMTRGGFYNHFASTDPDRSDQVLAAAREDLHARAHQV